MLCAILVFSWSLSVAGVIAPEKQNRVDLRLESCTTRGCVLAAARLLKVMDQSVDPCSDFYKYSCGNYITQHVIPEDKTEYGVFDIAEEQLQIKLKAAFEDTASVDIASIRKTKNAYSACINTTVIDKLGMQPALNFLKATNPWPLVQPDLYNETTFDILQAIANVARQEQSALIALTVETDVKNSTGRMLHIKQPNFGMPSRDYLLRNISHPMVQAYLQYMTSVATILMKHRRHTHKPGDALKQQALISTEMLAMLEFEMKLATIAVPKELQRDPEKTYNKMTIKSLQQCVPELQWLQLLQAYMKDTTKNTNITIDENESVIVDSVEFLQQLAELTARTPKRIVANYLAWRIVNPYVIHLGQIIQEPRILYAAVVTGQTRDDPRWRMCIDRIKYVYVMSTGRMFVDKYFSAQSKTLADSMLTEILKAFKQGLDSNDWLGAAEKQMAREKTDAVLKQVAYDKLLQNTTWLNERYALYQGNVADHFGNVVRNARASDQYDQQKLRQRVDRLEWDTQAAILGAFYSFAVNSIMVLAGMLQEPFFSPSQPAPMNFGGIGTVMAHEITHGFDDRGRLFDKDGTLRDWWTPDTADRFNNKSQCVVDYFNKIRVDSVAMNLNGNFTLGENIADLASLRLAYRAYKTYLIANPATNALRLPGLQNITSDQLFFISSASILCTVQRREHVERMILTDEHVPAEYRVTGQTANTDEFAQAFGCPAGSKMNPAIKCRVW